MDFYDKESNISKSVHSLNNIFIKKTLYKYIHYIKNCKNLKKLTIKENIINEYPFLSICISIYNLDKYIEKAIMSVINQSFQDFEIIIINDNSKDNTLNLTKKLQLEDKRIKIINHKYNLGTFYSRNEAVLNSKGKYILFLDPDDMILNPKLFEILFYYNNYYNLDIIEFTVFYRNEKNHKLYYPKSDYDNHYHNFNKNIIYQPELSNILFYKINSKNYSSIFCRNIWNKLYKKKTLLKTIKYIKNYNFEKYYIIVAEDNNFFSIFI